MNATLKNDFIIKRHVTLFNQFNNEAIVGDIINEDEIEGKKFFVVRVGARVMKLAKDAYSFKKSFILR